MADQSKPKDGVIVGHVVPSDANAKRRAEQIRIGLDAWRDTISLVTEAYKAEDWKILGYDNWTEYVDKEFGTNLLKLDIGTRKQWTKRLIDQGLPTRDIAPITNVNQSTVVRDANASDEPEAESAEVKFKKALKAAKTALTKILNDLPVMDSEQDWIQKEFQDLDTLVKQIRARHNVMPGMTAEQISASHES